MLNIAWPFSKYSLIDWQKKTAACQILEKSTGPKYSICHLNYCWSIRRWLLFSRQVMFDSLRPRGLQHTRPPCPAPSPAVRPSFKSNALVMPSSHLILWCPLLLPSIFPSTRDFCSESIVCIWLRQSTRLLDCKILPTLGHYWNSEYCYQTLFPTKFQMR